MMTDDCGQCDHPMDPHELVNMTGDPMDGGVVLCPDPGCLCLSTWSPQGVEPPELPDLKMLKELWRHVWWGKGGKG